MKRGEHLLSRRSDWNRVDIIVAAGFQDALGVRAVGLVAPDVRGAWWRRPTLPGPRQCAYRSAWMGSSCL